MTVSVNKTIGYYIPSLYLQQDSLQVGACFRILVDLRRGAGVGDGGEALAGILRAGDAAAEVEEGPGTLSPGTTLNGSDKPVGTFTDLSGTTEVELAWGM